MNLLAMLLQDQPDTSAAPGMIAAFIGVYLVFILFMLAAIMIPLWFICKKAGYSPWLSLLTIVPFGFLILLYVLAFGQWKVVPVPQLAWQPPPPPYPPLPPQA